MAEIIYWENDNVLELSDLTNDVTGAVVTTATVTCTLKDKTGTNVTGETWPLTMPHIAAGLYRAKLSRALSVKPGLRYVAQVIVNDGDTNYGHWELPLTVQKRTGQ